MIDRTEAEDRDPLIEELEKAGARFVKPTTCICPFHEDAHQSGSIFEGANGVWRFRCHASGCGAAGDVFDIRARVRGVPLREVLPKARDANGHGAPRRESSTPKAADGPRVIAKALPDAIAAVERLTGARLETRHDYINPATGRADFHVLRLRHGDGAKTFRPIHEIEAGFVGTMPEKPWPLYGREHLLDADRAIYVEGEKAADVLVNLGFAGFTSPGGAGKASHADFSPVAGKTVYVWPDKDAVDPKTGKRTGIEHGREVLAILGQLDPPCRLYWIDPDAEGMDLPDKGDAFDYVNRFIEDPDTRRKAVEIVLSEAMPIGPANELARVLEEITAGRRKAIPWPWPCFSRLTRALLPGTVTLFCGDPGATKSLMTLQADAYWTGAGIKVALFELEEDRAFHLHRALAQAEGDSTLLDPDDVERDPKRAQEAFARHAALIDALGRSITDAPDKQVPYSALIAWIKAKTEAGARIVAIDPVTAAESSREPWVADARFLIEAKAIIGRAGASLVLVTHPKKGRKGSISLDDLAGGAAFARFSQTVAWIERHDAKSVRVRNEYGQTPEVTINRTLRILKSRNGAGHGLALGFYFSGSTLRADEQGVIVK